MRSADEEVQFLSRQRERKRNNDRARYRREQERIRKGRERSGTPASISDERVREMLERARGGATAMQEASE